MAHENASSAPCRGHRRMTFRRNGLAGQVGARIDDDVLKAVYESGTDQTICESTNL